MKKILFAVLMATSFSASAQTIEARQKNEVVKLRFPGIPNGNEVYVAASTVCLNGKLFAVAVQKNSSGENSGVTMTQVMETRNTNLNYVIGTFPVDCVDAQTTLAIERMRKAKQ